MAATAPRGGSSESYEAIASEQLGLPPGASPRRKRRWVIVMALIAAGSVVFGAVVAYLQIGPTVAKENESLKEYDASQRAFTVSVQPEEGEPESWAMVLDRELTAGETREMRSKGDSSSVYSYLRGLGGRPLEYAAFLDHAPPRHRERETGRHPGLSDTFKVTFQSTRAYGVTIDDWEVVDVKCGKSTAQAVVALPPQGGAPYEGVRLHIPPRADEPVLTDKTEGQGKPYFDLRFIEVGGGQPATGLRVEAIAPPGQWCEWGIKVHYVDPYSPGQFVPLVDGTGKPVRIRTESVPENPRQKWVFGSVPWMPCHEQPKEDLCGLV